MFMSIYWSKDQKIRKMLLLELILWWLMKIWVLIFLTITLQLQFLSD